MIWKEEMSSVLEEIKLKLFNFRKEVDKRICTIEENKPTRDKLRKEILLKEMKLIIKRLEEEDKKFISVLKSDTFDIVRQARRLEDDIQVMEAILSGAPQETRSWRTEVAKLSQTLEDLDLDSFLQSLELTVGPAPSTLFNSVVERVSDVVHLQTPNYSPSSFSLTMSDSHSCDKSIQDQDYFVVEVRSEDRKTKMSHFILKKMVFSFRCQVSGALIEECSVLSKIENKRGLVQPDGTSFKLFIKRPKNLLCTLAVKLFNSNITHSPQLQLFRDDSSDQVTQNMTVGGVNETGIEVFDCDTSQINFTDQYQPPAAVTDNARKTSLPDHQLDDSDLRSLGCDLINPLRGVHNAGLLDQLKSVSSLSRPVVMSPGYHPIRRVSGERNMFTDATGPGVMSQLTEDTSPFRPSAGAISTMRPTVASQLSEALEDADTLELEEINETDLRESSIMDPSKRSTLSVEEIQRSLSSEESGVDGSYQNLQASKLEGSSVSFAAKTQVNNTSLIMRSELDHTRWCQCWPRLRSPLEEEDSWWLMVTPSWMMARQEVTGSGDCPW